MDRIFAWSMVAATILLTTYGQIVLKWQVERHVPPPFAFMEAWPRVLQLALRPWVLSAFFAAFLASLCWMLALQKLELGKAYPFMALSFMLVSLAAVPLFDESLTPGKLFGLTLLVIGLTLISRG